MHYQDSGTLASPSDLVNLIDKYHAVPKGYQEVSLEPC